MNNFAALNILSILCHYVAWSGEAKFQVPVSRISPSGSRRWEMMCT